jgi:transcriptional regulator with XRE-family HTH domain
MSDEPKDDHSQDQKREALSNFLKEFEAQPEIDVTDKTIISEEILSKKKDSAESNADTDTSSASKNAKAPTSKSKTRQEAKSRSKDSEKSSKSSKKTAEQSKESSWFTRLSGMTSSAFHIAKKTTDTSFKVGKVLMDSQDQLKLMLAAGQTLKDFREVAGLTISELSDAINLGDKTLLVAVENGTAALSFELILRLASLLARNDPIPFIIKLTRAYSPETWRVLTDWGLGRIPLQYEREREFINIYRSHDEARKLSDAGFKKVLEFTRTAFEMSLHFITEQENALADQQIKTKEEKANKNSNKDNKQQPEE